MSTATGQRALPPDVTGFMMVVIGIHLSGIRQVGRRRVRAVCASTVSITGVETQVACQLLRRRGPAREACEDPQLLAGDRDPRHRHAEQRVPGGNRREVQPDGEPVECGVGLQAGAQRAAARGRPAGSSSPRRSPARR